MGGACHSELFSFRSQKGSIVAFLSFLWPILAEPLLLLVLCRGQIPTCSCDSACLACVLIHPRTRTQHSICRLFSFGSSSISEDRAQFMTLQVAVDVLVSVDEPLKDGTSRGWLFKRSSTHPRLSLNIHLCQPSPLSSAQPYPLQTRLPFALLAHSQLDLLRLHSYRDTDTSVAYLSVERKPARNLPWANPVSHLCPLRHVGRHEPRSRQATVTSFPSHALTPSLNLFAHPREFAPFHIV